MNELIFEDVLRRDQWNLVIEYIKEAKPRHNVMSFNDILYLACENIPYDYGFTYPENYCFACDYDSQTSRISCLDCPLKHLYVYSVEDIRDSCLLTICEQVYHRMKVSKTRNEFKRLQRKCLRYAKKMRDAKVKSHVICRSQLMK